MVVRKRYSLGCIFFNLPLRRQGDWDSCTCSNAARNGHLDVLKWAQENGCFFDLSLWEQCDLTEKPIISPGYMGYLQIFGILVGPFFCMKIYEYIRLL